MVDGGSCDFVAFQCADIFPVLLFSFSVEMGVKVDREKSQPAAMAPPEDDEEGPVVWYHEGPPELTIARYWIADYSISKYGSYFMSKEHVPLIQTERKH